MWDVVIVGGGPAGLSAAQMLGRARRRTLVIDAGRPRNRFAAHMHGVLGQDGTPPDELRAIGRAEAAAYGVEFVDAEVARVDDRGTGVAVLLADGSEEAARAVIVATGLADALPDIPGLAERWGASVLHCPYCHGWEFRDRRLAVLTTSPMGMHQAELIRQWSDDVTVFTAGAGEIAEDLQQRLRSRGVKLIASPIVEVLGDGAQVTGARTADGRQFALDAIYTAGTPTPLEGFLADVDLERAETPLGSFLAVDAMGRTSNERIWAVGNVVNPMANVPVSMGSGSMVGGAVNGALVTIDFDTAAAASEPWPDVAPAEYWETRYRYSDEVWSGRVNAVLADVAAGLDPGTALDLGCGEGADVVWLASRGWDATGIDISAAATERAAAAAASAGLTERAHFVAADLADLGAVADGRQFDLVTASFLHSPVALPRDHILREAAERVRPGGHLLVTSHADFPPWSAAAKAGHTHRFPTPAQDLASIGLDTDDWEPVLVETRARTTTGPDGAPATLDDGIVLVRRR